MKYYFAFIKALSLVFIFCIRTIKHAPIRVRSNNSAIVSSIDYLAVNNKKNYINWGAF